MDAFTQCALANGAETMFVAMNAEEAQYLWACEIPTFAWRPGADTSPLYGRRCIVLHTAEEPIDPGLVAALDDAAPLLEIVLPFSLRKLWENRRPDALADSERAAEKGRIESYLGVAREIDRAAAAVEIDVGVGGDCVVAPLPDTPELPHEALGPVQEVCEAIAREVQVPLAMAAASVLATSAHACQHLFDLQIDDRRIPLSLYFVTVAESGCRKSEADRRALEVTKAFEERREIATREKMDEHRRLAAVYEAEARRIANGKATRAAKESEMKALGGAPLPPPSPVVIVRKGTPHGIGRELQAGAASIALFSDDAGEAVGGWAFSAENVTGTGAALCKLYDGEGWDHVTAGGGTQRARNRRASLHYLMQGDVARNLFGSEVLRSVGFFARTLIAWPDDPRGTGARSRRRSRLKSDAAYNAWQGRIARLLDTPVRWQDPDDWRLGIDTDLLTMDDAADAVWSAAYDKLESGQAHGAAYEGVRAFASRGAEQIARVAGVYATLDGARKVGAQHVEAAAALVDFYLAEAVRLRFVCAEDKAAMDAQQLLDWLRAQDGGTARFEQVYHGTAFRSLARLQPIVKLLVSAGKVETGEIARASGGRRAQYLRAL